MPAPPASHPWTQFFIRIDFVLLDYLLTSRLQIFSRSSIINVPEHNWTYKCLEVRQFSSIQEIYRIYFSPLLNQTLRPVNFDSNLLMLSIIMSVAIADWNEWWLDNGDNADYQEWQWWWWWSRWWWWLTMMWMITILFMSMVFSLALPFRNPLAMSVLPIVQ